MEPLWVQELLTLSHQHLVNQGHSQRLLHQDTEPLLLGTQRLPRIHRQPLHQLNRAMDRKHHLLEMEALILNLL